MMNIINKFKIDSSLYLFILIAMLSGYLKDIVIVLKSSCFLGELV